jgi:predicted nucleotidyltransferase
MGIVSEQLLAFLSEFIQWAAGQPDILGVALVGSHARDEATDGSDMDLIIVASEPKSYLEDMRWAQRFGTIDRQQMEHYGKVTSLRVWYLGGREVEYGFTDETWSAWPLDEGTRTVISDGMRILWERGDILSRLQKTP